MQEFIKINREDTVAVALKPLSKGSTVAADPYTVVLNEDIPQGHKFAVCQIPEGAPVVKYGCRIGYASRQINPGTGCISIMYALPWAMCWSINTSLR